MKSFVSFLNEAYSIEMKSMFSKEQLSKIGEILNKKYYTSVQDSEFKHYTVKEFKTKYGKENTVIICRLIDKSFVICSVKNQKTVIVEYTEEKSRYFSSFKDVLDETTDVFVFVKRVDNVKQRTKRWIDNKVTDPLAIKQSKINKKSALQNDYIKSVNDNLKPYGMSFSVLCYVMYNKEKDLRFNFKNKTDVFDELATVSVASNKYNDGLNVEIIGPSFRTSKLADADKIINSIEKSKEVFNIIKGIDFKKIPVFTQEEYDNIILMS